MTVTVHAAGVDTWSPCWYVDRGSLAAGMLADLASVKTKRGFLMPEPVGGHRIGWNPGAGMLYAEGHPSDDGLGSPDQLPEALQRLTTAMLEAGVPVPNGLAQDAWNEGDYEHFGATRYDGFAGVRRCDATVDLHVSNGAEGVAILAGVAAIVRDTPRVKLETIYSSDGRALETVYMLGEGGKKVLGRWYDKGVESGGAARGQLIRPEDQRRYVKGTRRHVAELTSEYVRTKFHQRFVPLWRASKGVTVGGPLVLAEKLADAVEAGEITAAQAELLAGNLLVGAILDRRRVGVSKATRNRRRAAQRELGLVLADGVLQEVEVDLHDVMEQALDAGAWAPRRG